MQNLPDGNGETVPPDPQPAIPDPQAKPAAVHSGLPSIDLVKDRLEKKNCDPETINLLVWFVGHARSQGVKYFGQLGELIGYEGSAMSKVLSWTYGASPEPILAKISNYREVWLERSKVAGVGFIDTLLARELWNLCDFTRISKTLAFLHGPNQSGKTTALQEYQRRNNHGKTIFLRAPVGGAASTTIEDLAKAAGITTHDSTRKLLKRMHRSFTSEMLLIVDESHQLFQHGVKRRTIESLRELHDQTGTGIVFCGTDVLIESIDDAKLAGFVGQLANRGTIRRRIKPEPYKEDVYRFCEAYGFGIPEPGTEESREIFAIANSNGLGKLSKIFQMAQRYATKAGQPYTWHAVKVTLSTLRSWEKGDTKGGSK